MSDTSDAKIVRNTFEIIIIITLLSALIALAVISVANDMYAFVKPDGQIALIVSEPLTLGELSRRLQAEGVVKNPTVFSMFVKSKGRAETLESFSGEITLRRDMSYREIMLALS